VKILHVSTLSSGGAFNAANRLHQGLKINGVDSVFLTLKKHSSSDGLTFPAFGLYGLTVKKRLFSRLGLRPLSSLDRLKDYEGLGKKVEAFALPSSDYSLGGYINRFLKPDIINLHWVSNFLDYKEFFSSVNVPVIWTLHDEQPFSAYWHYSNDRIQTPEAKEIEKRYFKIKDEALNSFHHQLSIVAPSQWLLDQSKNSPLFKDYTHKLIRYGLDTDVYRMTQALPKSFDSDQIAKDKVKLLFICQSVSNQRKGMKVLLDAFSQLDKNKYQIIAVGEANEEFKMELSPSTIYTGSVSDEEELARIYNFCDAMIIPSKQDNLPNTMLESLSCGTPVIGTPAGGIAEILLNPELGILSESHDPADLASAIRNFSLKRFDCKLISTFARDAFSLDYQAKQYLTLYKEVLDQRKV
jgi:glycosyltransferase involved in cell wall biosynthesis